MTLDTSSVAAVGATVKATQSSQAANGNGKPKEKRRSNEKRKEKSRDAARCRRSRETEIFTELAQVLPLPKEEVDQLDKASVMRLAIGHLKIREMLQLFPKIKNTLEATPNDTETNKDNTNEEDVAQADEKEEKLFDLWKTAETHKILTQTLDGFLIILSNDGDVTYVSENITEYLGISKIDILGQQIWEYSHQCDHEELKEAMNIKKNGLTEKVKDENLIEEGITTDHRDLFIRLKCTLTSRGRSVNIKSATYKVIHITGHLVVNAKSERALIAIGRPIPHPSNIEIPLGSTTFLTKHSLDMKFTYVDDKMSSLFGYKPEDLLDKSLYDCHHGGDSDSLMATFKSVLSKGQGETCRYRFLGKCGGYCWIVTQATIVYDKQKPQSVVCVNYVISNLEKNNEIYSLAQYEASQAEQTESNVNNPNTSTQPHKLQQQVQQQEPQPKLIELNENKPKLIQQQQQSSPPQQPKEQKQTELIINLDPGLVPELPKKTCADVDEKKSTSAGELQLKRELPLSNSNVTANTKPSPATTPSTAILQQPTEQVSNNKYVPSVPPFRVLPYNTSVFGRSSHNNNSNSSTYGEENRPKSVTASVFRSASDIEKPIISASSLGLNHTIAVNQTNLPQLKVAPSAQSVTASVFTPISQLRTPQILQSANRAKILLQPKQQQQQTKPQRAVAMNKGYLTFPMDTSSLTMLKEEPDDLAHLAQTGVDACLPLDDSTPLFGEMLAGLMPYGSLLPDDINSLDSQHNGNHTSINNKGHIDPFINYADESNDTNCSQHLLSPSVTSKSAEASSLPSLCSPNSLSQDDDFAFMTMNVDDEIDLTMRAPFIPMNEQDDLPLLTDDLMWGVGFTSDDLANYKEDAMQFNSLKQQMNVSTGNQMLNNSSNNNNCNSPNMTNLSPAASPMSISSSSAASSPSPCSSNSPLSMHNQQFGSYGGSLLCNARSGGANGSGGGGGLSDGGGSSARSVDDSDSGISSINSMSPQHTHPSHKLQHHHQNHHNQQQQQQHQRSPMSIANDSLGLMTCKKEIDGGNLCESIDAFDSVYTKDSPNLECWPVPVQELLNINSNDSRVTVDDLQQTHKQQNIIINTTTMPTNTLHVPLITIQNNKNISMNQQQQQQQQRSATSSSLAAAGTNTLSSSASSSPSSTSSLSLSTASSVTTSNCHNNSNNNNSNSNNSGGGNLILSEDIIQSNRKLTGKIPTNSTSATIRISHVNSSNGRHQTSPKTTILQTTNLTALQANNHKRHLVTGGASALDSKRLKNSSSVEIQTTPHLLQQLMAPVPQKQTIVVKTAGGGGVYDKTQQQQATRWGNENGGGPQQQMLCNQQDSNLNHNVNQSLASSASSNSVLKNLLVSGCDNIIVKTGPEIMITEDISNDSIAQLSPCDSFGSINCDTSNGEILRSCRSNPMIGGSVLLPSPPFPPDDNPPDLLSMSETEASCDSGIDESCSIKPAITKNLIPDTPEKLYPKVNTIKEALKSGDVLISNVDQCINTTSAQVHGAASPVNKQQQQASLSRNITRKSSLSFMDNGNPVLTSFLMDLCNDDYNMNESDYLEDNDLVQVLNELTHDIDLSGGGKA